MDVAIAYIPSGVVFAAAVVMDVSSFLSCITSVRLKNCYMIRMESTCNSFT